MLRQTWISGLPAPAPVGCASDVEPPPVSLDRPVPGAPFFDAGQEVFTVPSRSEATNGSDPNAYEECAAVRCRPGDSCCWADGQCYPDTCLDCCPSEDDRAFPVFARMRTDVIPRDDLAGPRPPMPPVPEGPTPPGPGSPDPGPMPPGR